MHGEKSYKEHPQPFEVVREKTVFEGFFKVREEVLSSNGSLHSFNTLVLPGNGVSVVAKTEKNKLLITKEWRQATKKWLHGLVGGLVQEGEEPLVAARRELLEETGYDGESFELIGSHYPFPGTTGQKIDVVLATKVTKKRPTALEPLERIEVNEMSLDQLNSLSHQKGEIDGVMLASLYLYRVWMEVCVS